MHQSTLQCETICNFHLGEVITSLQKTTLLPGGNESLVYTTLSGSVGVYVPLTSREVGFTVEQNCLGCANTNLILRIMSSSNIWKCT